MTLIVVILAGVDWVFLRIRMPGKFEGGWKGMGEGGCFDLSLLDLTRHNQRSHFVVFKVR